MTIALRQGDLGLLDTDIAKHRLDTVGPLRLAYTALDGTPRVIPVQFQWTGEEIVMAGFAPSARARALRVQARVDAVMTPLASTSWLPTAPQGNVTRPSHWHVPNWTVSVNATNTFDFGEAGQS